MRCEALRDRRVGRQVGEDREVVAARLDADASSWRTAPSTRDRRVAQRAGIRGDREPGLAHERHRAAGSAPSATDTPRAAPSSRPCVSCTFGWSNGSMPSTMPGRGGRDLPAHELGADVERVGRARCCARRMPRSISAGQRPSSSRDSAASVTKTKQRSSPYAVGIGRRLAHDRHDSRARPCRCSRRRAARPSRRRRPAVAR